MYLCAGDPDPAETVGLMEACADGGADVIELGVPFSDPAADGPVIQAASQRALAAGTKMADVLDACRRFSERRPEIPVVLFGYWNPWHRMGAGRAAQVALAAGAAGLLVVDLPPEESAELDHACAAVGLARVFLVAPTTDDRRIAEIGARGTGFLYLVSLKGVTGAALTAVEGVRTRTERTQALTGLPVAVGFGVAGPEQARAVGEFADGVVVGTALVRRIAAADSCDARREAARAFTAELKRSLGA
jgi:tryptophan synthase alpha chain